MSRRTPFPPSPASPTLLSRRRALKHTLAAASAVFTAPAILSASVRRQELHVAAVGVNGMGWSDLSSIGTHAAVKFVGFCDIDDSRFDKADAAYPGVPHFADYREMFAQLGDRVDAVIVSTPDHMHAPVAMKAMAAGKHIYCQKPLTHTVWESRQMRLLAEQKNLTTQMGNQIHSASEYRTGVRLVHDGAIGRIQEVHSWVGVQGRQYCNRTDRPESAPVPSGVHWDLWLGAAAERPFAADVYHPFKWRDWQDFGSGALGDFGCHILDPVFGALGLTAPVSVISENSGTTSEVWPGPETVTYEFPGTSRTARDMVRVIWRDGGLKPPRDVVKLPADVELPGAGSLLIGDSGCMILPHVGKPQVYTSGGEPGPAIVEVPGTNHWHDWVDAVLAGRKTTDGFEYAGPLAETVQLGNIAARLPGQLLKWDAASLTFQNHDAAQKLVTKTYRAGFEVTAAG